METYHSLSILYFVKTLVNTLLIFFPLVFIISALSNFLKNNSKYKFFLKKFIVSFVVLVCAVYFDKYKLFSNIDFIEQWHNVNTSRILAYQDENLFYVPVIIEPMYIKNRYTIDIDSLKEEIIDMIGNENISLSFYNFNSLQQFDINGDEKYIAASVAKVHVVMNLYDYAYENNIDLKNTKIKYASSDFQGGAGILKNDSNLSSNYYSLEYLAEIAIRHSDNIAKNMINRYMSNKRDTVSYYKGLVGSNKVTKQGAYLMSSNWASDIMKKLYFNELNNPYYDKLVTDLKNTTTTSNIVQYLDKNIVAHKIGQMYLNGYLYSNDSAIIYSDSEYILTIFSKSKMSTEEMSHLIGSISQVIYNKIASSQN